MGKYSMRFDLHALVQDKTIQKVGIEQKEVWSNVGGVRDCSFRYVNGEDYFINMTDKTLNTAMVRMARDPRIRETMRIVLLGGNDVVFKIISVQPATVNGRRLTQLKVQRWEDT